MGEKYNRSGTAFVDAVRLRLELGEDLRRKKAALGHGNWLPWVEANERVLGFGHETARLLINAAAKFQVDLEYDEATALQIGRQMWGNDKKWSNRHSGLTGHFEWYTPQEYVDLARNVMGGIDLDPATHEIPQRRIKAEKYFTEKDDGLTKEWHGRVWLNPPYAATLIYRFVDKLLAEIKAGRVTQARNQSGARHPSRLAHPQLHGHPMV